MNSFLSIKFFSFDLSNLGIILLTDKIKVKELINMADIIWTIISLLILFWLIGFIAQIGGAFIHFLLVVALILIIFKWIKRRKIT